MTDNELNVLIVSTLDPAMQADPVLSALPGISTVQNFQPRQQGRASPATIYFVKLFDKRYGFPKTEDTPLEPSGDMQHTETQVYETTYQLMALVPQDPAEVYAPTESDVLNLVAGIIAGDAWRDAFIAQGVGVLRVTDVRNPYFVDEHDRFEASPSFDVTFTHKRVRTTVTPRVVAYDFDIKRV